ncbi:hypothetical protein DXG03_004095 [Asterophora parasitica]|uniref:Uncharacterized protein n=1 Tax=Asterophora parasitica TaxID=117018 RepID=A0A9P7G2Z9_9AGAR|nr:hypothetical protein DXG03_004095 [Asterophora parasitica]
MITNITPTPKREPSIALVEIPSKVHYNGRIAQELAVLSPAQRQEIADRLATSFCEVLAIILVGIGREVVAEEVASEAEATVIDTTLEEIDLELEFALTVPLPEDDDNDDTDNHCEKTELVHPVVEPPKSKEPVHQSPEVDSTALLPEDARININETVKPPPSVVVDVDLDLALTTPLPEDDNSTEDCEMVLETTFIEAHKFDKPAHCQSSNVASTVSTEDKIDINDKCETVEHVPTVIEPRARNPDKPAATTSSTPTRKAKVPKVKNTISAQPSIALHGLGRWSDPDNGATTSAPSTSRASRWEHANSPYLWTNVVRQREQAAAEAKKQEEKMRKLKAGVVNAERAAERVRRMIEEMRRGRSEVDKVEEVVLVDDASSKVEDDGVLGLALSTPLPLDEEEDGVDPVQADVEELALADIADDEELALALNTPLPPDDLETVHTAFPTSEDALEQDELTTLEDEELALALNVPLPLGNDELELVNLELTPSDPVAPEEEDNELALAIRTPPLGNDELEPVNLRSASFVPAAPEEDDVLALAIWTPLPIDDDELEPVNLESATAIPAIPEDDLFTPNSVLTTQHPLEDYDLSLALSVPLPPDADGLESTTPLTQDDLELPTADNDGELNLALSVSLPPEDELELAFSAFANGNMDEFELALRIPLPPDVEPEAPEAMSKLSWDDEDAGELPQLDVTFASPSTIVAAATADAPALITSLVPSKTDSTPEPVPRHEISRAVDRSPAPSAETVDQPRKGGQASGGTGGKGG